MKIKQGIRPWQPNYNRPRFMPPVNMILEMKNEKLFSDSALLYQGMLKYGIECADGNGIRFTDMANWLIRTLPEFINYYSGSKAKTPLNIRLENRRDRIKQHFVHLFSMELFRIKRMVHAKKNEKEIIPLYELTLEGQLLAWIMKARNPEGITLHNKNTVIENKLGVIDQKRIIAIAKVFETIIQYFNMKESYVLESLSAFFNKCFNKGVLSDIIDSFYYCDLKYVEVNRARDLLRLFTKMNHPLDWIFAKPSIFIETINEIDNQTRKLLMANFKMEIEEYYNEYYLAAYLRKCGDTTYDPREFDPSEMSIAGKEWQLLRANNLGNEAIVIIPGKCSNCKSECPNKMDITKYLNQLVGFSSRTKDYCEYDNFNFDCIKCKKEKTVFGKIYLPSDMFRGHEMFSF
jgi:hypothetical protein